MASEKVGEVLGRSQIKNKHRKEKKITRFILAIRDLFLLEIIKEGAKHRTGF